MAKSKDEGSKTPAPTQTEGARQATGEVVQATPGGYEDSDRASIPARQAGEPIPGNVTTGVSLTEEAIKSESTPGTPRIIKPLSPEEEGGTTRALVASAPQSEAIPYPTSQVVATARQPPFVARVSGSQKLVQKTLEAQAKSVAKLKNPNDKNDKTGEIASEGLESVAKMVENFQVGPRERLSVTYTLDMARGKSSTEISAAPADDLHARFVTLEEYEEYMQAQVEHQQKEDEEATSAKAGSGKKKFQEDMKAAEKAREERDNA